MKNFIQGTYLRFETILKKVLYLCEDREIPADTKDLLARTVKNILEDKTPNGPMLYEPAQANPNPAQTSSWQVNLFEEGDAEKTPKPVNNSLRTPINLKLPETAIIFGGEGKINPDEIGEILKTVNTAQTKISFISASVNGDLTGVFKQGGVDFNIPLILKNEGSKMTLLPLFGMTNIFKCGSCSNTEFFETLQKKVLKIECEKCGGEMTPLVNPPLNPNPYYLIHAINLLLNSKIWILINPPVEAQEGVLFEILKTSFENKPPETVYILSKETSSREYYKQMFLQINKNCAIKSDFQNQDTLCEEFINTEIFDGAEN